MRVKINRNQGAEARLVDARRAAGFRSARAAALKFGWPEASYQQHERGDRTIGQDKIREYAEAFNVDWRWLATGLKPGQPAAIAADAALLHGLSNAPLIPIKETGTGQRIGAEMAPPRLAQVPGAFCILMPNASMSPRYEPGDMLYCDPHRPIKSGCYVVVRQEAGMRVGYVHGVRDGDVLADFVGDGEVRDAIKLPISSVIARIVGSWEG